MSQQRVTGITLIVWVSHTVRSVSAQLFCPSRVELSDAFSPLVMCWLHSLCQTLYWLLRWQK